MRMQPRLLGGLATRTTSQQAHMCCCDYGSFCVPHVEPHGHTHVCPHVITNSSTNTDPIAGPNFEPIVEPNAGPDECTIA